MRKIIIAIDGPAASGKSTTARLVADELGYLHLDTGAMYRAMTLKVLEQKIRLDDEHTITGLAQQTEIRLKKDEGKLFVSLDGRDVTPHIRTQAVNKAVSPVSSIKGVREVMVREQRSMGKQGGVVLEGRDIGTVVFPEAELKIFLIASVTERAKRRQHDLRQSGVDIEIEKLADELMKRDEYDSTRKESPLKKADDAILLDTTQLSIQDEVKFIVEKARAIITQPVL